LKDSTYIFRNIATLWI